MTIESFLTRKTLLVADTKPTPQVSQYVVLEELDSGNFYKSDGTTISIVIGPDKAETIKNKIIPVEDNEFLNFNPPIDHPFLKNFEFKGHVVPAADVANSLDGIIDGSSLYNPDSVKVDAAGNGVIVAFQSLVDDEKLGFASLVPIVRRDEGFELLMEVKSNAQTVLVGFSTAPAFDPATIFGTTDKGVALGWTLASPWISAYSHDGAGAVITTASAIGKGITLHTLEIKLTTANIQCIIDSGAQTLTLTTNIPALTDNLYLLVYGIH